MSVRVKFDGNTVDVGLQQPLFPIRLAAGTNIARGRAQYAAAPDGRFLVNAAVGETSMRPINVVLNWQVRIEPYDK